MAKSIRLRVLAPTGEVFGGEVAKVLLPGSKAPFVVLPGHAPIISSIEEGVVKYTSADGSEGVIEISGGFVEVRDNNIIICID